MAVDGLGSDSRDVPAVLRGAGAPALAERLAGAARRPDAAVYERGHGAVQAVLHGAGRTARAATDIDSEVLPDDGHRGRRRLQPPHVLPDAGELQHRRLLQARSDRLGMGAADGGLQATVRQALGFDLPNGRRGARPLARHWAARGADPAVRRRVQLLAAGRLGWRGAVRPEQRDLLRPRAPARLQVLRG